MNTNKHESFVVATALCCRVLVVATAQTAGDLGIRVGRSFLLVLLFFSVIGSSVTLGQSEDLKINSSTRTILTPNTPIFRNLEITPLATPGAPSLSTSGTAGSTSRTYKIVAQLKDGTTTAAGLSTTITTSNATLTSGNRVALTWTAVPGAYNYGIYRTATAGTPSTTGKIGSSVPGNTGFSDTGLAGDGTTPPTENTTGRFKTAGRDMSLSSFPGGSYAFRDFAKISQDSVSKLLTGKTANDASQKLFSTRDDSGAGNYARSITWFGYSSVDMTGVSVYTNGGNAVFSVTLIAPDVGITASHINELCGTCLADGDSVRFVAADGTKANPTILSNTTVDPDTIGGHDIRVIRFSPPLSDKFKYYKILSSGFPIASAQVVYTDQNKKAFVAQQAADAGAGGISVATSAFSTFYHLPVDGDSANPIFAVLDGEPVLLATFQSPDGGPALGDNVAAINAAMASLGSAYRVTQFYARGLENSAYIRASSEPTAGQVVRLPAGGKFTFPFIEGTAKLVSPNSGASIIEVTTDHGNHTMAFDNYVAVTFGTGKDAIFRTALQVGHKVSAPANAGSTGTAGDWAADTGFIYICTATDTWKRVAIATW